MLTASDVQHLTSSHAIGDFFNQSLGYRVDPVPFNTADLGIPTKPAELVRDVELLCDYQRQFQVYRFEVDSLRRTDLRTIIEPVVRKQPQPNYLFVFTKDYSEHAFVSPVRVIAGSGATEPKLHLRTLRVDRANVYHTDLETLDKIRLTPSEQTPAVIWRKHEEAFSVQRVTSQFYAAYTAELDSLKAELLSQHKGSEKQVHGFAQLLLNRLMFLYFLQRKGWLKWEGGAADKRYLRGLYQKYQQWKAAGNGGKAKSGFYDRWLSLLFFDAFNRKYGYLNSGLPKEVESSFGQMPFLDGGLFSLDEELDGYGFTVSDAAFERLFGTVQDPGLLERYNFTVDESKPLDEEVAVDPEMLGFVYESLVQEQERHEGGIFYTPRTEIDLMCRWSLVEFLHGETGISKEELIPFVFATANTTATEETSTKLLDRFSETQCRKLRDALRSIKVVDPAVGSGSFLVGMMNVLVELRKALAERLNVKTDLNDFALKQYIISSNLYGVDVMDWAVRVCELRLWLSLVIESDERQMNIYNQPLLPKLSFRVRQGDSLVEEVAGVPLTLRGEYVHVPPPLQHRLLRLAEKKDEFFRAKSDARKDEIERDELLLLQDVINAAVERLDKQIAALRRPLETQHALGDMEQWSDRHKRQMEEERRHKEAQALAAQRDTLIEVRTDIAKGRVPPFFLWDVGFAEVFQEKGGFDIVIGNPPYVKQEEVAPPLESADDYDADDWRARKHAYKQQLERSVRACWGNAAKIDKKSDLYVYFYYHGLALLREGGVFCFVNSNSWLDVGYGAHLQEFLLKNMEVLKVVDNHAKRTFKHADVNTVIVLLRRPKQPSATRHSPLTKFIVFRRANLPSPVKFFSCPSADTADWMDGRGWLVGAWRCPCLSIQSAVSQMPNKNGAAPCDAAPLCGYGGCYVGSIGYCRMDRISKSCVSSPTLKCRRRRAASLKPARRKILIFASSPLAA